MAMHPLLTVLTEAAHGRFPEPDGEVTLLPGLPGGASAVLAFTGHSLVATALSRDDLAGVPFDGFGGSVSPGTLLRLAGDGQIGVLDVTLAAPGLGGGALPRTSAWDDHHRVRFARGIRSDVVVHGDERGFVTLARGLAGRREMSVEVTDDRAERGAGRALVLEARRLVPARELLFAAVSPGNARSLRAFLAAGFVPLGSEVLITPPGAPGPSEHHQD
jgi:hypothetical protein